MIGFFLPVYLILQVPFAIVNGILTGLDFWNYPLLHSDPASVSDQIVWYDNSHNLGIRLFSIPIDDILYGALLILMNWLGYSYLLSRRSSQKG
ncbi:MAG: hypothetical protein HRT74_02915 [Flavobacteriales bacterium]|nr:hypothetical protein [Flavobacteriales bacterium]